MEVKDEDWEKALSDKDKYKVAADRVRPTDHMDEKARAEEGAAKWPTYAGECERMRRWNIPSTPRGSHLTYPRCRDTCWRKGRGRAEAACSLP